MSGGGDDGKVVRLPPAQMPPDLVQQMQALARPVSKTYAGFPPLEPSYHPDARKWLEQKRAALSRLGSREDCHDWLVIVACGVNNVTESEFKTREMAVWDCCDDLPALVWCKATRRLMFHRTPFLPGPGEVRAVLDDYLDQFKREIAALERISYAPNPARRREVRLGPYTLPPPPEWATRGPTHRFEKAYPPGSRPVSEILAALKDVPVIERTPITPKPPDPQAAD